MLVYSAKSCLVEWRLPPGTFDTARTPRVDPFSAAPVHFVGPQIEEAVPEDASVVPWQDRNTYTY